jgi:CubicO group peptidase (beta-lactamase class C family)
MNRSRVSVALAVALMGCAGRERALDARVDRLLGDYAGTGPGACVLARQRGAIIYEHCVGMADVEHGEANTPETDFRLASLTKAFTATAVLTLVADGRLSTTTTLRHVFPDFPPWADRITIHHLLSHTSGLVDYEDVMAPGDTAQITDAGVRALLRTQDSTDFAPGSRFRYSNSGYAMLAQVIEAVSGVPFGRYLDSVVFAPLGMAGTVAHVEGVTVVPHRAFGYSRGPDGSWIRTDQSPTSAVLGDGGIYTSVHDLDRWLAVVEGRKALLPPALAALPFTAATRTDDPKVGYGYGWFLDSIGGEPRISHTGTTIGFRNAIQRLPGEDVTVVFLSNRNEIQDGLVDSIVAAVRHAVTAHP